MCVIKNDLGDSGYFLYSFSFFPFKKRKGKMTVNYQIWIYLGITKYFS